MTANHAKYAVHCQVDYVVGGYNSLVSLSQLGLAHLAQSDQEYFLAIQHCTTHPTNSQHLLVCLHQSWDQKLL